jgi:hypothetical protein
MSKPPSAATRWRWPGSKPLRDELGPPVLGSREPQERILATPPAYRRKTIVGPIWTSSRSSTCGAQDGQAHRVVTHRRRPDAADVRRRVVGLGMRDSELEPAVSGRGR